MLPRKTLFDNGLTLLTERFFEDVV